MLLLPFFIATAAASCARKANLFVSSYAGSLTSLELKQHDEGFYSLRKTSKNLGCGESPSWLTLDSEQGILYCLNEAVSGGNGSVTSYDISVNGSLAQISRKPTLNGPVSGVLYGKHNDSALALAHYGGSAVTAWKTRNGNIKSIQDLTFKMSKPGPVADRQDAPHEHEAILDPTGQYILVPDLGADLVRVFCFDEGKTDTLAPHKSLKTSPGVGPRHAAFHLANDNTTYMYLVTELANTVTTYKVSYPAEGGLAFQNISVINTFGGKKIPTGAAAAEIAVSPNGREVVVSNRADNSFRISNPDPKNATAVLSDSLATFNIHRNGTLGFKQLWPSGGSFPRQFQINKKGDMVAVANQLSSRVVILDRDLVTGRMGYPIADLEIGGEVTCVIWDE